MRRIEKLRSYQRRSEGVAEAPGGWRAVDNDKDNVMEGSQRRVESWGGARRARLIRMGGQPACVCMRLG